MKKISVYKSPETAELAEKKRIEQGKPHPDIEIIQVEWLWYYRKYKKLYEGLMKESERLSCLLVGNTEGFLDDSK